MFNTRRFLVETFGNPQGVVSFLGTYDVPAPSAGAVQKWFERESIPSEWLVILLAYVEIDRGQPMSLAPFLEGTK